MLFGIGAILLVAGLLAAAVLVIGVPTLLGYMAYDVATSSPKEPRLSRERAFSRSVEASQRRITVSRGIARAVVIAGGLFWASAAFAAAYMFRDSGASSALLAAAIPLFATLVTLVIGWYWERVAAIMLVVASVGIVYFGTIQQFEPGVWGLVAVTTIIPMLAAAVLFWMARREAIALEFRLAHPELAMATSKS